MRFFAISGGMLHIMHGTKCTTHDDIVAVDEMQ